MGLRKNNGIDLEREYAISLDDLRKVLKNRYRIQRSRTALWKWARFGRVRRHDNAKVYLDYTVVGGVLMTSVEAFHRMNADLTREE